MARHRKTPAARHQAQGRDDGPASSDASERRFSAAMRRVVVTPTVAAGLGVVVAAVLAYPMQTVFNYAGPAEAPCQPAPAPCGLSDGKAPALGSGNRMNTASPAAPHSGGNGSTSGAQPGSHDTDGRGQAGAPQLTY